MTSGKPSHPDRLVTPSARECAEWGTLTPAAHLTVEEVEQLTEGIPVLGLRHGVDPVFDPVAARALARDRVAALCTEHDAPLTAITRRLDGSLTLCATCARRDWGRAD